MFCSAAARKLNYFAEQINIARKLAERGGIKIFL